MFLAFSVPQSHPENRDHPKRFSAAVFGGPIQIRRSKSRLKTGDWRLLLASIHGFIMA
jgi:hypothetical protein